MISLKAAPIGGRYDEELEDWIELTPEELSQPGFIGDTLKLKSRVTQQTYFNEKGFFTLAEVVLRIVKFERADRKHPDNIESFGGIDDYHVFFEGLKPIDDAYEPSWGS